MISRIFFLGALLVCASSPARAEGESGFGANLFYARLGGGVIGTTSLPAGGAIGLGFRQEWRQLALDLSALNLVFPAQADERPIVDGSWVRLAGLWLPPTASERAPYFGAGASYGPGAVASERAVYRGKGPQLDLIGGLMFPRGRPLRAFFQVDVTVPLYQVEGPLATGVRRKAYAPSVAATFGLGWGRPGRSVYGSAEGWKQVSSRHFDVYTNVFVETAENVLARLEEVYAGLEAWFPQSSLPRMEILILNAQEFHDLLGPIGGMFVRGVARGPLLIIYDGSNAEFVDEITAHELAHGFIDGRFRGVPLWFNEGFATYLETMRTEGEEVWFGGISADALDEIATGRIVPLEKLVTARREDFHGKGERSHYATAWAVVHYLLHGENGALRPRFDPFVEALRRQEAPAAFAAVYPELPLATLEERLTRHVHSLVSREGERPLGMRFLPPLRLNAKVGPADDAYVSKLREGIRKFRRPDRF